VTSGNLDEEFYLAVSVDSIKFVMKGGIRVERSGTAVIALGHH